MTTTIKENTNSAQRLLWGGCTFLFEKMNSQEKVKEMGAILRGLREKNGISIWKVAKISGANINSIKAVEDGVTNYTIHSFLQYLDGCGLSIVIKPQKDA